MRVAKHTPPRVDVSGIENKGAAPDASLTSRALSMSGLGSGCHLAAHAGDLTTVSYEFPGWRDMDRPSFRSMGRYIPDDVAIFLRARFEL